MKLLYITKGQKLKVRQDQLLVEMEEDTKTIEPDNIEAVIMENPQCSVTGFALVLCQEKEIPVIVCNESHQPTVLCDSLYSYYKLTSMLQEQMHWKEEAVFNFYKSIIIMKVRHQADVLKEYEKEDATVLEEYLTKLPTAFDYVALDHIEAVCARVYFKALFGANFSRENDNTINAGLNYGYALLRSIIANVVVAKGFHPSLGLHHHSQFNNYNLVDDLIEVYRPMVDYLVYQIIKVNDEFNKDFRMKLLQILSQPVWFKDKQYSFKQNVIYFVDYLKAFMHDPTIEVVLPELRIDSYEY